MKKLLLILLAITATFTVNAQIVTPQPSPFSKVEQKVGLTDVTLEYSRPSVRERTIFGDLVPYGKVWRTGANARTKITFSTDVTVDGQTLKAGTYAIFTKPEAEKWEVYFYSDYSGGGVPQEWDDTKVAAKTMAESHQIPFNVETFTIDINAITNNDARIEFIWEKTFVGVTFNVPTDDMVLANINDAMNGTPTANDYYAAAIYYLQEGKDIKQAKTWIDKAIAMAGDKVQFWQLRQQSLIYAKAGDKKGAIAAAKKSLTASEAAGNADYVKMNKDSLKEWGGM
ncbi:DUF2911 domain-containing protein [Mariniflexile soesokkakense]|uniref:DUF2911 domain-containing protein n=1 Tax=Mariniflexile soesokkakense TaxID=1343160 RepID=A0ABV0AA27_9FLAO